MNTAQIILSVAASIFSLLMVFLLIPNDFYITKKDKENWALLDKQKEKLKKIITDTLEKIGYRPFGGYGGHFSNGGKCFNMYVISEGDEYAVQIEFNEEQTKKMLDEGCLDKVHTLQLINNAKFLTKQEKIRKLKELVIGLTTEEIKEGLNIK